MVSRTFDIPKSSVHVIVHRVSNAIIRILRTVIAFPTGDDVVAVGEGFALLAGSPAFNSAVGAIDACHIRLKPPATTAQCYLNRKLFLLHPEGCRMTKPEEEQQYLNVPFPPMVGIQPNCSSEGQD